MLDGGNSLPLGIPGAAGEPAPVATSYLQPFHADETVARHDHRTGGALMAVELQATDAWVAWCAWGVRRANVTARMPQGVRAVSVCEDSQGNVQAGRPLSPAFPKTVALQNSIEGRAVKARKRAEVDEPCPIFWAADGKRDGGKMLRAHDAHAVALPFDRQGFFHRFAFEPGICLDKLDGKSSDEDCFLVKCPEPHFRETGKQWIEGNQQRARRRIHENKDIDIPRGQGLAVETRRCRAADRVAL